LPTNSPEVNNQVTDIINDIENIPLRLWFFLADREKPPIGLV
jgi:hypothetical protein